jgi:hypothetical protein
LICDIGEIDEPQNSPRRFSSSWRSRDYLAQKPPLGAANSNSSDKDTVTVIQFSDPGQKLGPARVKKVQRTDAEWKQQLTPLQFEVTRKQETERGAPP